jgi:sugar (pentulose or hexulose) kinase
MGAKGQHDESSRLVYVYLMPFGKYHAKAKCEQFPQINITNPEKRMPIILGVDLGTTKITALALETGDGEVLACATAPNEAEITSSVDKTRGYSEWDARQIAEIACRCLRQITEQIAGKEKDLLGIGITGQQHGAVLIDDQLAPLTPLINWQDRRGDELIPGKQQSYVERAREQVGPEAPRRAGCKLAAGYMGVTLFWMKETGVLPGQGTACFLMDYFGAWLTGKQPITDATCAASSGLLNVALGDWDQDALDALNLRRSLFPDVHVSGKRLGGLTPEAAEATGLLAGLPVFAGIGDNQASYLGSVGDPANSVLVNVGTGGQVAVFSPRFTWDPALETRPFPRGGFLLVSAGLAGGASYAVLERFVRDVGIQLFGVKVEDSLFQQMNQLASTISPGADGLSCEPLFSGTRAHPEWRASLKGASASNFTLAHLTRALLEGMAQTFRQGYEIMVKNTGCRPLRLVGAGNGLRENQVLSRIVMDAFGTPLEFPSHREEAAVGATLLAGVSAGAFLDLAEAGKILTECGQEFVRER